MSVVIEQDVILIRHCAMINGQINENEQNGRTAWNDDKISTTLFFFFFFFFLLACARYYTHPFGRFFRSLLSSVYCSSLSFVIFFIFFFFFFVLNIGVIYPRLCHSSDLKASLYDRSIELFQRRIDMATARQTNNDKENWDAKGFVRKTFLYESPVERKSNVP